MKIFIENPANQKEKREYIEELNSWEKVGTLAVPYPYPYGYVVGTMQEDGDPLDAFLITDNPSRFNRGDVVDVDVIGLAEYFEDGERDHKILTRAVDETGELDSAYKENIKNFLLHAFDNMPDKKVRFGEYHGKREAKKEILNTQNHAESI